MNVVCCIEFVSVFVISCVSVAAQSHDECKSEDQFWDIDVNVCKICTRCAKGWQTTVDECGFGVGSQGGCEECGTGFYQDEDHTKKHCKLCTTCDTVNGVRKIRKCTASENSLCECIPGFVKHIDNICIPCNDWECLKATTTTAAVQPISRTTSTQSLSISSTSPVVITPSPKLRTSSFSTWTKSTASSSTPFPTITTQSYSQSLNDIYTHLDNKVSLQVILITVGIIFFLVILMTLIWKYKGREYINRLHFNSLPQRDPETGLNGKRQYKRSESAPAGLQCSWQVGTSSSGTQANESIALGARTRDKIIKMGKRSKEKEVRSRAEKAKAKGNGTYIDKLGFNVLQNIDQKLAHKENSEIKDWRHLANKWRYTQERINHISSDNSGLMKLFEIERTEHPESTTLESLINDLEDIKRHDVAKILIDYVLDDITV